MAHSSRLPVAYLPHGGGPWPFVEIGMPPSEVSALRGYLEGGARELVRARPAAILVISAHWEERAPTVMTSPHPPMLYDYSGFPPESYRLTWPAPGAPEIAARVQALLGAAGVETKADDRRGFDHGTFVPLMLTFPDADVPTAQLSLVKGLDPAAHLAIGRALAPLRDEGVLILGSGMSFHNMRAFFSGEGPRASVEFDTWLGETIAAAPEDRDRRLLDWARAPSARAAHPREEHLLPLMVVAGAAGADRGRTAFTGSVFGQRISAHHFG